MHARIAFSVSSIALLAMLLALGIPSDSDQRVSTVQRASTVDDLWAEAILYSMPTRNSDSTVVIDLYNQAIDLADQKAPLYVALGDFYRGPLPVAEQMQPALESIQRNRAAIGDEVEGLISTLSGNDECIYCYTAAVAVDPNYYPAWYRLACYGEADTALHAIRWLQENAPENALGWYLEASRLDDDTIEDVLRLAERGNKCPRLMIYPPAGPQRSSVTYPSMYDELEGKSAPMSAIVFVMNKQNEWFAFTDPVSDSLCDVFQRLYDSAEASANAGEVDDAVRKAMAAHTVAVQMVRIEPPNGFITIEGAMWRCGYAMNILRKLLPPEDVRLVERERTQDRIVKYKELIRGCYLPALDQIKQTDPMDIMLGRIAPVQIENDVLHQIREQADLETQP